jgi:sulfite reductase (ferredoxin)
MIYYTLPTSLDAEIDALERDIFGYRNGLVEASRLKARRIAFGVYEQREEDTYMMRIRCPGGAVTPRQLQEISRLSVRYGSDAVHFTTRQEPQLHDVRLEDIPAVMRELKAVGLSCRGGGGNTVRNILASWDSGITPHETFDVEPYGWALTTRLTHDPDSWDLPRKFKIGFANSEADNAGAVVQDIGFVAVKRDGHEGFRVYVAGGMGRKPQIGELLHEFIPADDVYLVAMAVKQVFHKNGDRQHRHTARLRFLWNKLGRERFLELYAAETASLRKKSVAPLDLPADLPGKQAPYALVDLKPIQLNTPEFTTWKDRYVRPQKQFGLYSILVPFFLGQAGNTELAALADTTAYFGEDVVRLTVDQNLALRNIPGEYLPNVYLLARRVTDLADEPPVLGRLTACTGASTCKLGICRSRGLAAQVRQVLSESELELDKVSGLGINISGCPNACGRHMIADLGLAGRIRKNLGHGYPAYSVVAGGMSAVPAPSLAKAVGEVSSHDAPSFLLRFLEQYIRSTSQCDTGQRDAEQPDTFAHYLEAGGKEAMQELCGEYGSVPSLDEDRSYYFDWGVEDLSSKKDHTLQPAVPGDPHEETGGCGARAREDSRLPLHTHRGEDCPTHCMGTNNDSPAMDK